MSHSNLGEPETRDPGGAVFITPKILAKRLEQWINRVLVIAQSPNDTPVFFYLKEVGVDYIGGWCLADDMSINGYGLIRTAAISAAGLSEHHVELSHLRTTLDRTP